MLHMCIISEKAFSGRDSSWHEDFPSPGLLGFWFSAPSLDFVNDDHSKTANYYSKRGIQGYSNARLYNLNVRQNNFGPRELD